MFAPLVFLVLGSFSTAALPSDFTLSKLSLENYRDVWTDPGTYEVFYNTLVYVGGTVLFAVSLALTLAWLVERTNVPGKIWIYAAVPLTLAMPGMLQAMAYVLLFSPRIGFINKLVAELGLGPFNIYSLGGMIFVEGMRLVPTAFLMMIPLLRSMDPMLEEAAAMSGANPRSTLRKVTLRLMLPGLLAVTIYTSMTALEVFEVPGVLGLPAGIYVFSTKIYSVLHSVSEIPEFGKANALAMLYLALAVVATWLYIRVIARSERFSIVTGKGYRPRQIDLGKWRWGAIALVGLVLTFSIVLPFLVLLYMSFLPYIQAPSAAALQTMSLHNYAMLTRTPMIGQVLLNTVYMVVVTSTATVLVSFAIALVVVRSRFRARRTLDQIAFMPHAIPGIVLGIAFGWLFLQAKKVGIDIYGGIWAISIAFVVSFISYGTRAMSASMLQIHKDLEEAAQMSGARPWRTMWRIFYPLMLPAFAGLWIWCMLHAVSQASKPLVLYQGNENQVLSVMLWNMWDDGRVGTVGALGALLVVSLLAVVLGLRLLGFGRGAAVQKA